MRENLTDEECEIPTRGTLRYLRQYALFALETNGTTNYYRLIQVWNLGVSEGEIGQALIPPYETVALE